MENTNSSSSLNTELNPYLQRIYTILQIVHLITVIIPSFVIGAVVLFLLFMVMSRTGVKPILLLYAIITIFCIVGSAALAIFWVLSLYSDSLVPQNSTTSCTIYTAKYVICYTPFMIVCYGIGMTSVVQYVLLHVSYKRIVTLRLLVAFSIILAIASVVFTFVITVGICVSEQRQYHRNEGRVSLAELASVYIFIAFVVPFVIIVIFSVLTHLKVNREVSFKKKEIVRSVLAVSGLNIAIYALFKFVAVSIYFVGISVPGNSDVITKWLEIARYVSDLGYPFTILSILLLNPKLRRMALVCVKTEDQSLVDSVSTPHNVERSTEIQKNAQLPTNE